MEKINLKVASFNISGGFYIGNEDTEYLDRKSASTIDEITTVDNMHFDDILVHKNIDYSKKIVKLLSDHFVVIDNLEINSIV